MSRETFDTTIHFGGEYLHVISIVTITSKRCTVYKYPAIQKIYLMPFEYDITELCLAMSEEGWSNLIRDVLFNFDNPALSKD